MYKFRLATESEKNEKDSYGNVPEGGEWIYGSGVGEGVGGASTLGAWLV